MAELLGVRAFADCVDAHDAPHVCAEARARRAVNRQRSGAVMLEALADVEKFLEQADESLLVLLVVVIGRRNVLLALQHDQYMPDDGSHKH